MALLRLGRVTEAETTWRRVIQDHPDFGRAWLNLASLSIQRKNWAEVEKFARVAVEREPLSAAAWNNLAIGLEELGQTAEAEAAYRKASEVDPRDYRALFNLGILLRKNARYDEAAEIQQNVLSRNPKHGGAHFELGALYAGPLGDVERAKVHLQATIGADPNHPRARQARSILRRGGFLPLTIAETSSRDHEPRSGERKLARISHQLSAAVGDVPHPSVFSRLGVLDVPQVRAPRPSGRKPHCARHLAGLATKPGEICGLAWGVNPPAAASRGRGRGSPAFGHSLATVCHDGRRPSVAPG
jgi:tetratricopeptide (TPR) repeat protein